MKEMSKARQEQLAKEDGTKLIVKKRKVEVQATPESKPETLELVDTVTAEQVMKFSKEMVSEFREILQESKRPIKRLISKVIRNSDGFIDRVDTDIKT